MHLSQLGLMFRASILNQLSAKVKLVRKDYTDARLTAALRSINNRENRLAERVRKGRMTLNQLENRAWKLAPFKVMLDQASHPVAHPGASVASRPVETVAAFRGVLVRAQCTLGADVFANPAVKQQLAAMLDPTCLRTEARLHLADAFWGGHLDEEGLRCQILTQARNEANEINACGDVRSRLEREAAHAILAFIGEREPVDADPQSRALGIMLSRFMALGDARAPETDGHAGAATDGPRRADSAPSTATRGAPDRLEHGADDSDPWSDGESDGGSFSI